MINWFEKIKRFYDKEIYDKQDVRDFVTFGKITCEEYEQITGEQYQ